jgi:hypothetical protein
VWNSEGRLLHTQEVQTGTPGGTETIPVSHLPAGHYRISLTDGKAVQTLAWQKL